MTHSDCFSFSLAHNIPRSLITVVTTFSPGCQFKTAPRLSGRGQRAGVVRSPGVVCNPGALCMVYGVWEGAPVHCTNVMYTSE